MARAAAASAVARLMRSSRPCVLRFFIFSPKVNKLFSTSPRPESFGIRTHTALRPKSPPASGIDMSNNEDIGKARRDSLKNSRNELKREAQRAVRWGIELATFSPSQIKCILRAASLEREVLDAILLVKRLGPDVREGKRRQFNYIGRLLRKAQPELMDALVQAAKDGDTSTLQALTGQEMFAIKADEEEDFESEEEHEGDKYMKLANRWFDGLVYKDSSITNEVYSVRSVDFDRQELRRLVRQAQPIQQGSHDDESALETDARFTKAKKSLIRFLRLLAKESLESREQNPHLLTGF